MVDSGFLYGSDAAARVKVTYRPGSCSTPTTAPSGTEPAQPGDSLGEQGDGRVAAELADTGVTGRIDVGERVACVAAGEYLALAQVRC